MQDNTVGKTGPQPGDDTVLEQDLLPSGAEAEQHAEEEQQTKQKGGRQTEEEEEQRSEEGVGQPDEEEEQDDKMVDDEEILEDTLEYAVIQVTSREIFSCFHSETVGKCCTVSIPLRLYKSEEKAQ